MAGDGGWGDWGGGLGSRREASSLIPKHPVYIRYIIPHRPVVTSATKLTSELKKQKREVDQDYERAARIKQQYVMSVARCINIGYVVSKLETLYQN
jgi:hypothetical protein